MFGRSSESGFLEANRVIIKARVGGSIRKVFNLVATLSFTSRTGDDVTSGSRLNLWLLCLGAGLIRCCTLQIDPCVTLSNQTGTTLYLWQPAIMNLSDQDHSSGRLREKVYSTRLASNRMQEIRDGVQMLPAGMTAVI